MIDRLVMMLTGAAIRLRWQGMTLVGVGLFVAGGASNWADRLFHGHVVDFLNVGIGSFRTGVFNGRATIACVRYRWRGARAVFDGLDDALA